MPDLQYAGSMCVGRRKNRAEIQIMSKDNMIVLLCPFQQNLIGS